MGLFSYIGEDYEVAQDTGSKFVKSYWAAINKFFTSKESANLDPWALSGFLWKWHLKGIDTRLFLPVSTTPYFVLRRCWLFDKMILQRKVQFGAGTNRHRIFPCINATFYLDNYDLYVVAKKECKFHGNPFISHFIRKSRIVRRSAKNRIFYHFVKTSLLVT